MAQNIITYSLYFFLYSIVGWFCESMYCTVGNRKWTNRGFLFGPMCPIYGTGAVSMLVALSWCKDKPYLVFVLGMVVCDVVEYLTSYIMEKLFHARWWDYSVEMKYHLNGRICLTHTFYWGVAAMTLIYLIHPYVGDLLISLLSPSAKLNVLIAIMIVFIADLIRAVKNALDVKKIMDKFNALKDGISKYTSQLSDNIENFQTNFSEQFSSFKKDTKSQMSEYMLNLEEKFIRKKKASDKTKEERRAGRFNRMIEGYPNLNRKAKEQLEELKNMFGQLFDNSDDEKK